MAATAWLLREQAPETCSAVWEALPVSGLARHGIYSGSEVYLILPALTDWGAHDQLPRPGGGGLDYVSFAEIRHVRRNLAGRAGTLATLTSRENVLGS